MIFNNDTDVPLCLTNHIDVKKEHCYHKGKCIILGLPIGEIVSVMGKNIGEKSQNRLNNRLRNLYYTILYLKRKCTE